MSNNCKETVNKHCISYVESLNVSQNVINTITQNTSNLLKKVVTLGPLIGSLNNIYAINKDGLLTSYDSQYNKNWEYNLGTNSHSSLSFDTYKISVITNNNVQIINAYDGSLIQIIKL